MNVAFKTQGLTGIADDGGNLKFLPLRREAGGRVNFAGRMKA